MSSKKNIMHVVHVTAGIGDVRDKYPFPVGTSLRLCILRPLKAATLAADVNAMARYNARTKTEGYLLL